MADANWQNEEMTQSLTIDGFHHVTLSVSDLERSIAWYGDVLGFSEVKRVVDDGVGKAMLMRGELVLTFVAHGERAESGLFNEYRCGLDHLSFALPDTETLTAWVECLDAAGVARGPITRATTGDMVAFRDLDNIALEFYTRRF